MRGAGREAERGRREVREERGGDEKEGWAKEGGLGNSYYCEMRNNVTSLIFVKLVRFSSLRCGPGAFSITCLTPVSEILEREVGYVSGDRGEKDITSRTPQLASPAASVAHLTQSATFRTSKRLRFARAFIPWSLILEHPAR